MSVSRLTVYCGGDGGGGCMHGRRSATNLVDAVVRSMCHVKVHEQTSSPVRRTWPESQRDRMVARLSGDVSEE